MFYHKANFSNFIENENVRSLGRKRALPGSTTDTTLGEPQIEMGHDIYYEALWHPGYKTKERTWPTFIICSRISVPSSSAAESL